MTTYVCTKCGYQFDAEKRPDLCPICYAAMHHLIPKKEGEEGKGKGKDLGLV